jgi:hypothetical protein
MYHTLEFRLNLVLDLETSPRNWLQQLKIEKGARLKSQLKPYVVETVDGPVEVADLFFDDGTVARAVVFACFKFADEAD